MRANEFITELFDQPYSYTWEHGQDYWHGIFRANNPKSDIINITTVQVSIERRATRADPNSQIWDMEFSTNHGTSITGEGDEFKIFATILKMIGEFLNIEEPKIFTFSAYKPRATVANHGKQSRVKLYTKLIDKFASKVNYRSEIEENDDIVNFILTRDYDR